MRKQDYLVGLIAALEPNEKRYFKIFSGLQPGGKRYLKLFDALENKKTYDGTELCSELVLEPWQLADDKHYPVSYTHLDVYKRQGLTGALIPPGTPTIFLICLLYTSTNIMFPLEGKRTTAFTLSGFVCNKPTLPEVDGHALIPTVPLASVVNGFTLLIALSKLA